MIFFFKLKYQKMLSTQSFTQKYYQQLKINYQHFKNQNIPIFDYFGIKNIISIVLKDIRI